MKAPNKTGPLNPRKAAFLSLLSKGIHIDEFLKIWEEKERPSFFDLKLAKEIAFGTTRRLYSLDYIFKKNCADLKLKKRCKLLFYTALYQIVYLDRVPFHSIVDETVELAKYFFGKGVASLFNAVLRKMEEGDFSLPQDNPSVYYSYPDFFIKEVECEYGLEKSLEIFEAGNLFTCPMVRKRWGKVSNPVWDGKLKVEYLDVDLKTASLDPSLYIQNATPAFLMEKMAQGMTNLPKTGLDLCAAPGGKLLMLRDLFPGMELLASDISEKRLALLHENLKKYAFEAKLEISRAEFFKSEHKFDIVLLDLPCSNSGVLSKRAEARWRLCHQMLEELEKLQFFILKNAKNLISDGQEIWYLTCSILRRENEEMVQRAVKELGLKIKRGPFKVIPDRQGWDGGFGTVLST